MTLRYIHFENKILAFVESRSMVSTDEIPRKAIGKYS